MKKIIISFTLIFLYVYSYAQLQEVRGIETNMGYECKSYYGYNSNVPVLRITYINNNDFDVSLDAEVIKNAYGSVENNTYTPESIVQTQSFVIPRKGTYVWTTSIPLSEYSDSCSDRYIQNGLSKYHSRYKAYKQ